MKPETPLYRRIREILESAWAPSETDLKAEIRRELKHLKIP